MNGQSATEAIRQNAVLVVFSGETDIAWLRVLKPGFRHCFAIIEDPPYWVLYDPLSHRINVEVLGDFETVDLERWFRSRNCQTVRTLKPKGPIRKQPFAVFTCVEAVKRIVGIRAPWVLTPWQLYQLLLEHERQNTQEHERFFC